MVNSVLSARGHLTIPITDSVGTNTGGIVFLIGGDVGIGIETAVRGDHGALGEETGPRIKVC